MKKVLVILAIFGLTLPALAQDVTFDVQDIGGGQVQISYDASTAPRAMGLTVSLSDATVDSEADVVLVDAAYNTNIDYAYSNQGSIPTDPADLGAFGHPLADVSAAGVATLPASDFAISFGVLDPTGNQAAGPLSTSDLITLQLNGSGTTDVTVDVDSLRGGVVGSQLTTNLPVTIQVALDAAVCVGDADGNGFVNPGDISAIVTLLNNNASAPFWTIPSTDPAYNAAADMDSNGFINPGDISAVVTFLNNNASAPFWSWACP